MTYNPAYPDTERTIALDFDGVIHNNDKGYHDGTIYGDVVVGAREGLKELDSMGYLIQIYTCKARKDRPLVNGKTGKKLIWEWLKKKQLDRYIYKVTAEKPPAFMYVDDNACCFASWTSLKHYLRLIKGEL